jgi:outer membrane protein OmpA-like peptidoglycan-associated protein
VAYVVQGVQSTKEVVAVKPKPAPTAKASTTPNPTSSPSVSSSPSAPSKPDFNEKTNTYRLPDRILFEVNQARLLPDAELVLDEVIKGLVEGKRYGRIVVTGYTDNTGTATLNKDLSRRRAQAVKRYLFANLPDPGRWQIAALGRGSENPLNENADEQQREKNRRVEIKVPDQQATRR